MLPSEYQQNNEELAETQNVGIDEQKRTQAFQMIQQKIQAAAIEKNQQLEESYQSSEEDEKPTQQYDQENATTT